MKKLSLAAALVLAMTGAQAATTDDSFDVRIDFTAGCTVLTTAKDFQFDYTAFGAAQSDTSSTVFRCTRGLTPTFAFDDTGADQTGASNVALNSAVTAEGVIKGVRYRISGATSKSTTGNAAAAGVAGAVGSNGTADQYSVALTVSIPGDQAGDGADGFGTQTRVLTITY
jgi:hypothetical protein